MTTVDHFLSTIEINGALTPKQAAQVLDLPQEGETAPGADLAGAPAPAPAEPVVVVEEIAEKTTKPDPDPDAKPEPEPEEEPAILAKDGKHLIAYEKLAEARESAKRAAAERDEAVRRAAELQAQLDAAAKDPAKEPAKEPAETRPSLVDLRRERYNALLDGDIDKTIALDEKIEAEVQAQRQQANDAASAFARVVQDSQVKYPALDPASDKVDRDAIEFVVLKRDALIQQGKPAHEALADAVTSAAKVFRWSDGQQAPAPAPTPDPKAAAAAAAAAIANAKAPVPASLSAIPGGKPGGLSPLEQLAGKATGPELLQVMENMSPEQIEAYLNRSL